MSVQLDEKAQSLAVSTPSTSATLEAPEGLAGLWSLRHLIAMMVKRDLLGRYKGSVMGFMWAIINPLGHLLLYTFVFSIVLKVRFSSDPSTANFALYLMAGLLPWQALAESLLRSTTCILEQPNLVKRVVFPLEILPLSVVLSAFTTAVVGTSILLVVSVFALHTVHWTIAFLPAIFLSQFLLVAGMTWLLGSLGVFLPDLRHVMALALSAWMYATPIVYPASAFPKNLHWFLVLNPMAGVVTDYRRVMLEGVPPDWTTYAVYTTLGVILCLVGFSFFCKTKRAFADVV